MLRSLLDAFWNEDVWLPPNTTWEDIAPGPDKAVVYTDHRHLLYAVLLALILIGFRYLLEKYMFMPFGKFLGIKCLRTKKAPYNSKLEVAYKIEPNIKLEQIAVLAKQTDLSERQVERWWRLRRIQDKPSKLAKFSENMWKCTFYLCSFSYGLFILWGKEWLWDIDLCFIDYPHQGITNDIWWYYISCSAFYLSLTISQFWDVYRKDFWLMFVHHNTAIALLFITWICNLHRIGSLVIMINDTTDFVLEAGKAAKYANYQKLCDGMFIVFTISWIITRLGILPFYITWSSLSTLSAAYYILHSLFFVIHALHLLWTWSILKLAYKSFNAGQTKGDIRSSSSEMSDSSHTSYTSDRHHEK